MIRVLIAEGDPVLRSIYQAFLVGEDVETRTADSALTCWEQLRSWRPDILVLDSDLPAGAGPGLLALMRDDPGVGRVPVLLLTSPAAVGEEAGLLGGGAVMLKPAPPAVLAGVICTLADSGWGDRSERPSLVELA
jgi:CheY-like chemotaxis protein